VVYLTFDDGPTPEVTDWVLDQLKEHQQKATFFCIGNNVAQHPELYGRILKEGHRTGNHTMNHRNGFRTSLPVYLQDVEECAKLVKSNLFRPPYGRIKTEQIRALSLDYEIVEWSIITRDYYPKLNRKASLNALTKHTKSGTIAVFHDSEKAFANMKEILPLYLKFLTEKGFKSEIL
jgi:peptidoglycan/xylan/chitin deacetylase (PgdA/CDA1 family)